MKGIRVFTMVVLLLVTLAGLTQAADNAVIFDVRGLSMDAFSLEYEKKVSDDMTLGLQGFMWNQDKQEDGEYITLQSLAGAVGARKYMAGSAFEGFYIGVYGAGATVKVTSPQQAKASSLGIAGVIGNKWLYNDIVIDIGVSLAFPLMTKISAPDIDLEESGTLGGSGVGMMLGIGYVW